MGYARGSTASRSQAILLAEQEQSCQGESLRRARFDATLADPTTAIGVPSCQLSGSGSNIVPPAESDLGTVKLADDLVLAGLSGMGFGAGGER